MEGSSFQSFYSIVLIIAGIVCLYWSVMMKIRQIPPRFMVNEADISRMKHPEVYCQMMFLKTILFGVVSLVLGIVDIYIGKTLQSTDFELIMLAIFLALVIWYAVQMKKAKDQAMK